MAETSAHCDRQKECHMLQKALVLNRRVYPALENNADGHDEAASAALTPGSRKDEEHAEHKTASQMAAFTVGQRVSAIVAAACC